MKALVTGAAGFIGSHIADRLLADGHDVVGLDSMDDYYAVREKSRNIEDLKRSTRFTFANDSVLNLGPQAVAEFDWVFHNAGQPGVRGSWSDGFGRYVENNVLATQSLLEAVHRAGPTSKLERLVYASSSSVYGQVSTLPTTEEQLCSPNSPYGVTKLAAEQLVGLYARNYGIPAVSLRYHTVYGPRQRPDMAIRRIIDAALRDRTFGLLGAGAYERDFTFVTDVVEANMLAASRPIPPGTVLNIAGGQSITMADLIALVESLTGHHVQIEHKAGVPGDVTSTRGSTDRAAELLGWGPSVRLEEGIARQLDWQNSGTLKPRLAG
jgi:nucleoside-diphosphate-sugar epimerase